MNNLKTDETPVEARFYTDDHDRTEVDRGFFENQSEAYRHGNSLIKKLGVPILVLFFGLATAFVLFIR